MKTNINNKLTIVIITRNRADSLVKTLSTLEKLPIRSPIIVVNNNSKDDTSEKIATLFPEIKQITLNKNLAAAGRNIGVSYAQTPYIAFCDDDSWWDSKSLVKAIEYMETYPNIGLIQANVLIRGKKQDETCKQMENSPLSNDGLPGPAILGFVACGAIVRKQAFEEVGGFNKLFGIGGEETVFAFDLAAKGWKLCFLKDITAFHNPSPIRNLKRRKQLELRNYVWSLWLRRPLKTALKETMSASRNIFTNIDISIGLLETVKGFPNVLRYRKTIPAFLEDQLQQLRYFSN